MTFMISLCNVAVKVNECKDFFKSCFHISGRPFDWETGEEMKSKSFCGETGFQRLMTFDVFLNSWSRGPVFIRRAELIHDPLIISSRVDPLVLGVWIGHSRANPVDHQTSGVSSHVMRVWVDLQHWSSVRVLLSGWRTQKSIPACLNSAAVNTTFSQASDTRHPSRPPGVCAERCSCRLFVSSSSETQLWSVKGFQMKWKHLRLKRITLCVLISEITKALTCWKFMRWSEQYLLTKTMLVFLSYFYCFMNSFLSFGLFWRHSDCPWRESNEMKVVEG